MTPERKEEIDARNRLYGCKTDVAELFAYVALLEAAVADSWTLAQAVGWIRQNGTLHNPHVIDDYSQSYDSMVAVRKAQGAA